MGLEGSDEGLPLVLVLGLVEYHVPMNDGVLVSVGNGGNLEGLELWEEEVPDLVGSPVGPNAVGVVQSHEAIFKLDTGFNQLLVVGVSDSPELGLGLSKLLVFGGIVLGHRFYNGDAAWHVLNGLEDCVAGTGVLEDCHEGEGVRVLLVLADLPHLSGADEVCNLVPELELLDYCSVDHADKTHLQVGGALGDAIDNQFVGARFYPSLVYVAKGGIVQLFLYI